MITAQMDAIGRAEERSPDLVVTLLCWQCRAPLAEMTPQSGASSGVRVCSGCKATTRYIDGIWHTLSPQRTNHFRDFIAEYELIRSAEGRGSTYSDYYLSLPYKDISGNNSDQWMLRARTFRALEQNIIAPLAKLTGRALRILDLGAGNGWLSYRLALLGHHPIAVDLLTNDQDGLGAATHYSRLIRPLFPRVQAELDRLPFTSSIFDLAIFNASFHYSENYEETFAEALRCTRPGGSIIIADTPWYAKEESGRRMVEEKHRHFSARYGFASDSISSLEYLTPERLHRLQTRFEFEWKCIEPFYGISWSLRPLRARLKGRRAPSRFRIYTARVSA